MDAAVGKAHELSEGASPPSLFPDHSDSSPMGAVPDDGGMGEQLFGASPPNSGGGAGRATRAERRDAAGLP